MTTNALDRFIENARSHWSGLNTQTTTQIRQLLIMLTKDAINEPWLNELREKRPASKELYKDSKHGYILLAHTEKKGTYRIPHNHGAGWVFYAVQSGEMEMTTYKQITSHNGISNLVSRGTEVMKQGDCKVFLPGDIHDTKCMSDDFIQYRLTSSDLNEEVKSRRMVRFMEC